MIISDLSVKHSVSVVVLAIIIIIVGMFSYHALPREDAPNITIPHVFVSTGYKGVSPSDIETSITIPIEKKLKGLEGVKKIKSVSSEGLSSIDVEFTTNVKMDDAVRKVKDKVDEAKPDLPTDLQQTPAVFEVNISEMPIAIYSLSGTCGLNCLKDIADKLKDDIETVPGVLEVTVTGGVEREIRIEPFPEKLAYYGIPILSLQNTIKSENQNTSGGIIRLGDGRFQLKVPGEFKTPDEMLNLVVGEHNGQLVYLREVAQVIDGYKEQMSRSRLNGRDAINITVKKRIGENIILISDQIDNIFDKRKSTWPIGTEVTKLMDKAKGIKMMVADLENNLYTGLILVIGIVFIFMGLRNAILVSVAIPFSMLITFIILYLLGITLNMVVLFSLSLVLGMLVDDAVVIVENIYRYTDQGVNKIDAAMLATSEVAYPVIGSTLTNIVAFAPLMYWTGIVGEFMKFLPITLIISLSASLFVALVINPVFSSIFMKTKKVAANNNLAEDVKKLGERPAEIKGFMMKGYIAILKTALNHRITLLICSFAILVICFQIWLYFVGLERPVEFFPKTDPESCYINLKVPVGADIDYIDGILKKIEVSINDVKQVFNKDSVNLTQESYLKSFTPKKHILKSGLKAAGPSDLENIEYIDAMSQVNPSGFSAFAQNSPNNVAVQFIDIEERKTPSAQTIEDMRNRLKDISGAKLTVAEAQKGPPTGAPINIEISGDEFSVIGEIAKKIKDILSQMPHVKDIEDDFEEGTPTVQVRIDRQKAAIFGLSTNAVGAALKTGYNGLNVSTYYESNKDYDITVQLADSSRRITDILNELMIPTPTGQIIPLTTIAQLDFSGGIGDITRINNERVVTVKANVDEAKVTGPIIREQAEKLLKNFPLPPGYKIKFTGEGESQQESQDFLQKAFFIALFLVFLVIVIEFNSIVQPFIIMTSVILSFGGVFIGLTVIHSPFGIIMAGIGVISLVGVVVKNAIVLIDYINKLRERGMEMTEAVIAGGATRLRPVLLTAITAILGLVPMVLGISYDFHKMEISWVSESSQMWRTMASVVSFGLLIATFLTLVVVPVLYSLFISGHRRSVAMISYIKKIYWLPYERITGDKNHED
ncbi:MAG: efflux RND transporter permease subunit [Nitrospirae bacterium]|nr:efflux RND transporter permease subunit [Nitrospirota bacterium]